MKKIAYLCYCVFFLAFITQLWYAMSDALTFSTNGKIAIVFLQIAMMILGSVANAKTLTKQQKKKDIRFTQIILFFLFLGNLTYLLFFDRDFGRTNSHIGYSLSEYIQSNVNVIPFSTIRLYINGYHLGIVTYEMVMINVVGNIIAFMPFAYFFPLFFKSQRNVFVFFISMLTIISSVEVLQVLMQSGSGDVDDLILNMLGVISLYLIFKLPFISTLIYGDDIGG